VTGIYLFWYAKKYFYIICNSATMKGKVINKTIKVFMNVILRKVDEQYKVVKADKGVSENKIRRINELLASVDPKALDVLLLSVPPLPIDELQEQGDVAVSIKSLSGLLEFIDITVSESIKIATN
jgi:hypothetical protein